MAQLKICVLCSLFLHCNSFIEKQKGNSTEENAYDSHCHSFSDTALLKLPVDVC